MRGTRVALCCSMILWAPLAGESFAGLIGYWPLDEGTGGQAIDTSGKGHNGPINGATWVTPGWDGQGACLQFDGIDDRVEIPDAADLRFGANARYTLAAWVNWTTRPGHWSGVVTKGREVGNWYGIWVNPTNQWVFGHGGNNQAGSTVVAGVWTHVVMVYDNGAKRIYLNGNLDNETTSSQNGDNAGDLWFGAAKGVTEFAPARIDDVRIYDHALAAQEVKALIPPKLKAYEPDPPNGATGVTMPLLQWTKGDTALFHDVYLGTTPDLTAAHLVGPRQPFAMFYYALGLQPGATYYWRVDEVEATGTIHQGDVWCFTVTPKTAWTPQPSDGATYVDPGVTLQWMPGLNATGHDVYLGTDRAAVEESAGDTFKGNRPLASYAPEALERGATYYWRVDEVAGGSKATGEVWSFTVRPVLPKTDPALVGWYKLEDERSGTAVDYSGWDYYGTLNGKPSWVEGYYGDALNLDGIDDYVDFGNPKDWPSAKAARSLCGWARTDTVAAGWRWIAAYGAPATSQAMFIGLNGTALYGGGYGDDVSLANFWQIGVWHHICLTYDGTTARLYADGLEVASAPKDWNLVPSRAHIGRQVSTAVEFWDGVVDDVRVYNVALTPEQIKEVMRGDVLLAWDPQPKPNDSLDIRAAASLRWSAGDNATKHDVYFGKDKDAVRAADTTSPLYEGRQTGASFSLDGRVEFGGGNYFWRIDEVEADGATIHKGIVWSFTIPAYLIVDEFERYTDDEGSRIYETWVDGWTNGTGSQAGNTNAPFAELTIIHAGKQALPLDFNNTKTPYYSEVEQEFAPLQNWTANDVNALSLWVRGNPASFVDKGDGAFTVGASGHDIWDNADDFRFVYKRLNGDGSVIVKTESLVNTNAWAKAGVMIRDSLDAGSTMAYMIISWSSGASFGWRQTPGGTCGSATQTGITAPQWVKLTRTGSAFTAQYSADGKTWTDIKNATGQVVSTTVVMGPSIYIGLCVTSHNAAATTTAEFSGAATTGNVTGPWQQVWIGDDPDRTNGAASLYVAVEDSAGKVAVASDPALANVAAWTEWKIPLSSLTGVNLAKVKKLYIGVGDRKTPVPDGAGRVYIDDIRVTKP